MIREEELGKKYYNLKRNTFDNAWFTDETKALSVREKIGRSNSFAQKGKRLSEETKRKISKSNKGKVKGPQSEEHIAKLSKTRKGSQRKPYKPWSEEAKKNKSLAMKGNTRRLGTGKKV